MSNSNDNYAMNGLPENPIDLLIAEVNHLEQELAKLRCELNEAIEVIDFVKRTEYLTWSGEQVYTFLEKYRGGK